MDDIKLLQENVLSILNEGKKKDNNTLSFNTDISKYKHIGLSEVKKIAEKIYSTPPNSIIKNTPTILEMTRNIVVIGIPFIINPILGIVAYIAGVIIRERVDVDLIPVYIKQYQDEIDFIDNVIANKLITGSELKAIKEYKVTLENGIDKLNAYRNKILKEDQHYSNIEYGGDDIVNDDTFTHYTNDPLLEEQYLEMLHDFLYSEDSQHLSESDMLLQEGAVKNSVRKVVGSVDKVDRKISRSIDNVADNVIDGVKGKKLSGVQEDIVKGRTRVSTLIKAAIATGVAVKVSPAIAALGAFTWLVRRGYIKKKKRQDMIAEIKSELEILDEKIRDSESDNDKEKKYQYMRLRRELNRSLDKLRYGKAIDRPDS